MQSITPMTQDRIKVLLLNSDKAVERAVLAIYKRQTTDEQNARMTFHSNGVGFRANHAKAGARWAKWILAGNKLGGYHLTEARNAMLQYSAQLHQIAVATAAIYQARKVILGR